MFKILDITYYRAFQDVRNILQELYLSLASDKEQKKVFPNVPNVPIVGFRNGKNLTAPFEM